MCVSRVLKKRIDEDLDEIIVQPGRDIPKEQYVRRRAYTKQHKSVWEAAIAKYKHVKCIFQNCHFLALSVEDMISHFGYCNGDGSFAKFTCPYCEGRVTSEKILQLHIKRSHGCERIGILNNHFPDIGEDALDSAQLDRKQCPNSENEFRILGENKTYVKMEGMEYDCGEELLSHNSPTPDNEEEQTDYESVNENDIISGQEMDVEESVVSDNQRQTNNQERRCRSDHIYSKRMGKLTNENNSNLLLVMKNDNLKHYSGPRNVINKLVSRKVEEGAVQDQKNLEDGSIVEAETSSEKSVVDCDNSGKFRREMIKFTFSPAQNMRRKIHQSYTNTWNQSIKANGFARCLVATCNFISLDIFHVQNHFKTCTGVPANGPNLCTLCNSWLPSAVELSIHSDKCRTYRNLADRPQVSGGNGNENIDSIAEGRKDVLDVEESAKDTTVLDLDGKNDGATETTPKKEKAPGLRISDIIKLKDNGIMDINRIIQPRPVLPKGQYLRRRAYTKQHKAVWVAALEKHKYVKCIFQNCHFVAMSLEDMIYHFGYCVGDGSFAKYECPHCGGRLTTKLVLDIHVKMSHPEMATCEIGDYTGEMDEEYGTNTVDLPSVEEMKKLVNSREIKTYERHSIRPRTTDVKSEPYEWCEGNEGLLSCVAVVLEENQTNSTSGCDTVTVEPHFVSGDVAALAEESCVAGCSVESEGCSVNNSSVSPSSERENSLRQISDSFEMSLVDQNRTEEVRENMTDKRVINRAKKRKDTPEEGEDAGTNESDQEKPPMESGETSGRKRRKNSESGRGENQKKNNPEGGQSERGKPSGNLGNETRPVRNEEVETGKRRGSKRRAEEVENGEASPKTLRMTPVEDAGGTKPPRRRGRPPKYLTPNPQTLAVKRENAGEKLEKDSDGSEVKCAKCDFTSTRQRFSEHNIKKHVGLSWIEGETPIDLSNEKMISACVRQAFKNRKSATCEICNCVKKSALGFVTHIQNCGKSEEEKEALKVACPHCPSRVLKYSLPMHLKLSHSDPSPKDGTRPGEENEVLTKRKSALRAANKFQEVLEHSDEEESKSNTLYVKYEKGVSKFPKLPYKIRGLWKKMIKEDKKIPCRRASCLTESTTAKEARRHHFMCPELPEKSYVCQLCDYYSSTEDSIQQHVKIHPKTDGDFTIGSEEEKIEDEEAAVEEEEEELEEEDVKDAVDAANYIKNKAWIPENPLDALEAAYRIKFFSREHLLTGRKTRYCRQSLRMTLSSELEETRDERLPLSEFRTNTADWVGMALSAVHNHLPSLEESMSFRVTRNGKTAEEMWRKLGRFEGVILEGASIIFTGGSVLSMAWCKNSCERSFNENPRQYLAVSSSKDMRKFQDIHEAPLNFSGCIQIWDCGVLKPRLEIPKMVVGIIHDSGQVWDLSWFPMDIFEESVSEDGATRIGLLGAACQDGTIRIWSICDPQKLKSKFRLPLYRTEPKVILQLEGGETVGCLRLAIGKTGVIAGGFANGIVAIWNLKAISSPFCRKTDKTFFLKPHLTFQAHRTSITALSMCPTNNRFIATSGLDRFLRLWDLECVVNPIESTIREMCLDNAWPLHWPVTVSTFEDVVKCTGRGMVKSFRGAYCEKHQAPLTIDNTCWSLSVNDWMNTICVCNNQGEVKIRFMRNMFVPDEKFRLRIGHPFSSTDLKLLNEKEPEVGSDESKTTGRKKGKKTIAVPRTYEEARRYFGLNFNDYTIRECSRKAKEAEKKDSEKRKEVQSVEEYPITSANKVCWNPNYGSFTFLAVGHQSGFVRIRQLEDARSEEEIVRFMREAKVHLTKR